MRDKVFYLSCFGFILGVLLRSLVSINFYIIILVGIIALGLFFVYLIISKSKWGVLTSLFIFVCFLGMLRFQAVDKPVLGISDLQVFQKVYYYGVIVDEPLMAEKNQKLTIKIKQNLPKGNSFGKSDGVKVLATVNFGENFKYGDEVKISGKLEIPENFITDQGKNFDYINYLRKDGIQYLMKYPNIEILSRGGGNKIKSGLFAIKNKFLEKIDFAVREPESLLLGGLVLGERSAFSAELREDFIRTGTIHIVALSGYNITIVAEWFMKLFSSLPQNFGISMGILAVFLFILMTGGSSTAVRAGVMATLALIARATGRNYDVGRGLILAGVIMIIFNPFVLVYDVSFQLSFIATVAVIFLSPRIEKYFTWVTKRFGLRDIVSVTFAAYVFVLPFILYKMGNLSLVALPANILVLPLIPITMIFGFITGLAGIIWSALSLPFGFMSYFLLHYELGVISILSKPSFASFTISSFPLVFTLLIYAYFIYFLFGRNIALFFKT